MNHERRPVWVGHCGGGGGGGVRPGVRTGERCGHGERARKRGVEEGVRGSSGKE